MDHEFNDEIYEIWKPLGWLLKFFVSLAGVGAAFWGVYVAKNAVERFIILEKVSPPFALVSRDGEIIYKDRLEEFGPININVRVSPENRDGIKINKYTYVIHFSKKPRAVVYFSQEGTVVNVMKSEGLTEEIAFCEATGQVYGGGCNEQKSKFIMQVFDNSDEGRKH